MYRIIGADGKEYGPVSADQLRQWIAEGRANADTRALPEGTSNWKRLAEVPEFSLLFTSATARPLAMPPNAFIVRRTNGFAVTSLIMGIIALTFGLCCCYGLPFNLLGIVFALIALSQINDNPYAYDGKGVAIAGLVTSIASLLLAIFLGVFFGAISILSHGHRVYRL